LRTIRRYQKQGAEFSKALKTASLSPDENVSLLASHLYDISLKKQRLSEVLKEGGYPKYITSIIEGAEKGELDVGRILDHVIDFLSSELEVKKRLEKIANSFKKNLSAVFLASLVVLYNLPQIYELGKAVNPNKNVGWVETVVKVGYLLRENILYPVLLGIAGVVLLFFLIKGDRFYVLINRLPGMKLVETMDKKLIASYVLLTVTTTQAPALASLKNLIQIPKLPKIREKLKKAYYKLMTKPHADWGEVFEVADVDRLLTVKLKTAKEHQQEELEMLISDLDELLQEQIQKAEETVQLLTKSLMMLIALLVGYIFITVYY